MNRVIKLNGKHSSCSPYAMPLRVLTNEVFMFVITSDIWCVCATKTLTFKSLYKLGFGFLLNLCISFLFSKGFVLKLEAHSLQNIVAYVFKL